MVICARESSSKPWSENNLAKEGSMVERVSNVTPLSTYHPLLMGSVTPTFKVIVTPGGTRDGQMSRLILAASRSASMRGSELGKPSIVIIQVSLSRLSSRTRSAWTNVLSCGSESFGGAFGLLVPGRTTVLGEGWRL